MAGKSDKALQTTITVVIVAGVAYVGYRLLSRRSAAQYANGGGFVRGANPSGDAYTQSSMSSANPLSSMLNAILRALQGNKGGGGSGGSGGGLKPDQNGGSLAGMEQLRAVADFFKAGQNDWLNGGGAQSAYAQSLEGMWAGTDSPIPYENQWGTIDIPGQSFNPFSDYNSSTGDMFAGLDPFAGGGGFDPSIDYVPLQTVDVGSFDL